MRAGRSREEARLRKLVPIPNRRVLDAGSFTLAEALKRSGHATAAVGRWHLGPDPTTQGFDVNVAGSRSGSPRGGYFSPYRNPQLPDGSPGEYLTDRLTDEAVRFIDAHRDRPFFLYLSHYAVHTPIQARKEIVGKYRKKPPAGGQRNARYAAMIESVDQSLGRVMARLDELGLAENTIACLFSDNGGHGPVTSMAPLRGAKGMLCEGGIRVPMIVRWPGRVAAGSRCAVPVSGIDFYPTFLEATGTPRPEGHVLDGRSLMLLLRGKGPLEREAIFWHFPAYLQATRDMKSPWRTTPAGAVRMGGYKLGR